MRLESTSTGVSTIVRVVSRLVLRCQLHARIISPPWFLLRQEEHLVE